MQSHRQYWLSRFSGELPVLELPADRSRPPVQRHRGSRVKFQFDSDQSAAFQRLLQEHQATLFMGVTALVNILLFRYSGQPDLVIGTPVAGREHPDLEGQVGYYLNTLALRNQINGADSFEKILGQLREDTIEAFSHQSYPFDLLVEELGLRRDLSRSPLFDVMIVWQTAYGESAAVPSLSNVEISGMPAQDAVSKFDLSFFFEYTGSALQMQIEYNTDIYDKERIERMAGHLKTLLDTIVQQPHKAVVSLDYLTTAERMQLLYAFNNTYINWQLEKMDLVSCFEQQVELTPDKTALVSNDISLSFRELNGRANQLAERLRREYGVRANEIVGISIPRNEYLVIGILGILKAGAAYLPIDPAYPPDRISYIIEDSGLKLLFTDSFTEEYKGKIQLLSFQDQDTSEYSAENAVVVPQPSDLAYVIYTSGSTGRPKGVKVRHQSVVNYLYWANDYYFQKERSYIFPVFSSISFDLTITSLLAGLYRGDAVRLYPHADPVSSFEAMFSGDFFNSLKITPAHIDLLNASGADLHNLEVVIVGGEELTKAHVETLNRKTGGDVKIFNEYGPTEATVGCVATLVTDAEKAQLIGKPISNTQVYILDQWLHPQPLGVPGELYISGDGLAAGYLNNETLTEERFVNNPFGQGKLYRTGDIARWNKEGDIEFFGRRDNQVKIRGYRIELGEIEQSILESGMVSQALVNVVTNGAEKYLVAYYTLDGRSGQPPLREYLQGKLPYYMIPAAFMELEQLSLTSNGKIDRRSLPVSQLPLRTYRPAETEMQQAVARVWEYVLGLGHIGIDDDFFEIGGHSVKAIQVISGISKALNLQLSFSAFMQHPTIAKMAEFLSKDDGKRTPVPVLELGAVTPGKPALYLISPLIGTPMVYKKLCDALSGQYNCFGLQDPGFDDAGKTDNSLNDKVSRLTKDILQHSLERKVRLLGFSYGATIAFEVAKQLELNGIETSLFVIDRRVIRHKQLYGPGQQATEQEDIKRFVEMVKLADPSISYSDSIKTNWHNNIRLMEHYKQSGLINGQLIAFKSHEDLQKDVFSMEEWKDLTSGSFSHYYLKGDHYQCLETDDNINRIYTVLRQKDSIAQELKINY